MPYNQVLGSTIDPASWVKVSPVSVFSFLDLTTILVFTLVFLALAFVMGRPSTSIPGPFALPFIGNLIQFLRMGRKRHVGLLALRKKYGDVFRLYVGPYQMVVISGYDNIHDAFVKHAAQFSDRPNWLPEIQRRTNSGFGIVWANGESWKKVRRFALQSMRDFGVGKKSLEEVIQDEAKTLSAIFASKEGQPISDVKRMMTTSISNVIHHVVFGFRYPHDDKKFLELIEALDTLFKGPGAIIASLPSILQFRMGISKKDRKKAHEVLLLYVKDQIEEHEKTYDENNIRDFVDLYIQSQRQDGEMKVNHLFRVILELFSAGTETTGTSLDWAFLYMISHPKIQEKCYEEIKKNVGVDREVRLSDKSQLPYIEATLMEVQRIANIANSSLPHTATEDVVIAGHVIPKNSIVMGFLTSSHLDPENFSRPHEFCPERFIDEATGKISNKDHLIPFSIGPRICPGESLARTEMFIVFSNLIQKFRFSKVLESDVLNFEGIVGITTFAQPYRLKAEIRE
ncbi:cytochrome P450 2B15-like [Saccostrea cucullata]|uniref:cytochrome P450 2B15-like n=1 Tax=Saccostrea cuccullata TaxID=36930 RepID=UPI002ED3D8D6